MKASGVAFCPICGRSNEGAGAGWRWDGIHWEHKCGERFVASQCGHFRSFFFRGRRFKVMAWGEYGHGCPCSIPWALVEAHEDRALANHAQDLRRLNERGGMSPFELYLLLEDLPFTHEVLQDMARAPLLNRRRHVEYLQHKLATWALESIARIVA